MSVGHDTDVELRVAVTGKPDKRSSRRVIEGARNAEANRHLCSHRGRRCDKRPLRRSCPAGTAIRLAAVLPLSVRLLSTFIPETAAV